MRFGINEWLDVVGYDEKDGIEVWRRRIATVLTIGYISKATLAYFPALTRDDTLKSRPLTMR